MEDIYKGDMLNVWRDEEMVYLSTPWVTINIPREDWGRLLADLKNLVITAKEAEIQELKELYNERQN